MPILRAPPLCAPLLCPAGVYVVDTGAVEPLKERVLASHPPTSRRYTIMADLTQPQAVMAGLQVGRP